MRVVALGMVLCGLAFISASDRSFGQQDLRQQPKPPRTLENLIEEPAAEVPPAKEAVANADLLAVPPEAEVAATINLIRDAYSNEYKGEPSVLMKTLKSAADQTDDAVRKFALLQEAEKEAVSSGDLSQAFEFLEKRGSLFKIDVQQSSIALIKEFTNPTGEMRKKLIEKLLQLSRTAFEADQVPFAKEAVALSLVLAEKQFKKTKGDGLDLRNELLALRNEALALQKDISQRSELFGDYEKALATLKKADAGACEREHTVVGRYLCFAKDDWKEGVAYLAKGEAGSLQEAAAQEVLQKSEGKKLPKDLLAVASVWWKLSEKPVRAKTSLSDRDLGELEKIREHSSSLYLEALPNLIDPIDRALATKRSTSPKASGPIFRKPINSIGLELVSIPKGTFLMGEGVGAVRVTLTKPFLLGKYEVTQGQWKNVMSLEPWMGQKGVQIWDDNAASFVHWDGATDFCKRLTDIDHKNGNLPAGESYRLPTEAEWEYACRAGTKTAFSFGDDEKQFGEYAWFEGNAKNVGEKCAHKVGLKKPNPWGLHDMHGNVFEWCSDWYGGALSGGVDPAGPKKDSGLRVNRGGSWWLKPGDCRSADRSFGEPFAHDYGRLGFRVARSQSAQ